MKPKRVVILVARTPELRRVYACVLDVWGYRVARSGQPFGDAVVTVHSSAGSIRRAARVYADAKTVALVRLCEDSRRAVQAGASHIVHGNVGLREALKVAVARKRGPKQMARAKECAL